MGKLRRYSSYAHTHTNGLKSVSLFHQLFLTSVILFIQTVFLSKNRIFEKILIRKMVSFIIFSQKINYTGGVS